MNKYLRIGLALTALACSSPSFTFAAAFPVIRESVIVCDPNAPHNCIIPAANGSIPVTGGGGGAVTIADGADIAEGNTTDASATPNGTGTVSAKLRTLTSTIQTTAAATAAPNSYLSGCTYNATLPTLTNGQGAGVQCTSRGVLGNTILSFDGQSSPSIFYSGDNINTQVGLFVNSMGGVFNGSTWDFSRSLLNGTNSSGTGIAAAGILAQLDDVSPTAITENQFGNLRMSAERGLYSSILPSATAASGITPVKTSVAASNLVAKGSAGNLYAWRVTAGAAAGYVMFFNATSAPADGTVTPIDCQAVGANATVSGGTDIPEYYSTGITIVFSTTGCFTKLASTTAFIKADVQ